METKTFLCQLVLILSEQVLTITKSMNDSKVQFYINNVPIDNQTYSTLLVYNSEEVI